MLAGLFLDLSRHLSMKTSRIEQMLLCRRASARTFSRLVLACACACSSASGIVAPEPSPGSVVGCYAVDLGRWSASRDSRDPPTRIALLDSIGTELLEKGHQLARPDPLSASMPFDMAWWKRLESEHLEVVFTAGGYVGVRLHLVWGWGDATWRGTAEAFTDVSPSVQAVASATLSPRTCG